MMPLKTWYVCSTFANMCSIYFCNYLVFDNSVTLMGKWKKGSCKLCIENICILTHWVFLKLNLLMSFITSVLYFFSCLKFKTVFANIRLFAVLRQFNIDCYISCFRIQEHACTLTSNQYYLVMVHTCIRGGYAPVHSLLIRQVLWKAFIPQIIYL